MRKRIRREGAQRDGCAGPPVGGGGIAAASLEERQGIDDHLRQGTRKSTSGDVQGGRGSARRRDRQRNKPFELVHTVSFAVVDDTSPAGGETTGDATGDTTADTTGDTTGDTTAGTTGTPTGGTTGGTSGGTTGGTTAGTTGGGT